MMGKAKGGAPAEPEARVTGQGRGRAKALFQVTADCDVTVRLAGNATLSDLAEFFIPADDDYFYPMMADAYDKGIRNPNAVSKYILTDLFPECPWEGKLGGSPVSSAMYIHVRNRQSAAAGYQPTAQGLGFFQQDWNRFIDWMTANTPDAIASDPVYKKVPAPEMENGSVVSGDFTNTDVINAMAKAAAPFMDGSPIDATILGQDVEVKNFWDLVDKSEQIAAAGPAQS
jgi:hypothetical protein